MNYLETDERIGWGEKFPYRPVCGARHLGCLTWDNHTIFDPASSSTSSGSPLVGEFLGVIGQLDRHPRPPAIDEQRACPLPDHAPATAPQIRSLTRFRTPQGC
jgi:hypothetical protein